MAAMASALEQRINGVDWAPLLRRCVRRLGWSAARANDVLAAYQQFLELKINTADFDASILSPPLLVDEMWHLHVLDTKRYKRDCETMVGRRAPTPGGFIINARALNEHWHTHAHTRGDP